MEIEDIPKKYGGKLDFECGMMPSLDPKIRQCLTMNPSAESEKYFLTAPVRWIDAGDDEEMTAIGVGSIDGKQRKEPVCTLHSMAVRVATNASNFQSQRTEKVGSLPTPAGAAEDQSHLPPPAYEGQSGPSGSGTASEKAPLDPMPPSDPTTSGQSAPKAGVLSQPHEKSTENALDQSEAMQPISSLQDPQTSTLPPSSTDLAPSNPPIQNSPATNPPPTSQPAPDTTTQNHQAALSNSHTTTTATTSSRPTSSSKYSAALSAIPASALGNLSLNDGKEGKEQPSLQQNGTAPEEKRAPPPAQLGRQKTEFFDAAEG